MKKRLLALLFIIAFSSFAIAAEFTVNNNSDTNDSTPGNGVCLDSFGNCTLRAAVQEANALASDDVIRFAPGLQTITLASGSEIVIANNGALNIKGPGANLLTIDGGAGNNRIFFSNGVNLSISGLSLTGGNGGGQNVFSGNQTVYGGAIFANLGNLTIDGVSFFGNVTINPTSAGGALYTRENTSTVIKNSAFYDNKSGICGAISNNGPLVLTNTTISGNSTENGFGGGICLGFNTGYVPTLRNVTITNNSSASRGGGISFTSLVNNAAGILSNNIIAGNTAPNNPEIYIFGGNVTSDGGNLVGNSIGDSVDTGIPVAYRQNDIRDTPPLLGALQNNGGTTPTHALLVGSLAIDAGFNAFIASTDQRGFPRLVGAAVDIGAYEKQSVNCDYNLSPRDTIVPAAGGSATFNITAQSDCSWNAVSNNSWITVTAGNSGTGNGTVNFSVAPNNGAARTGTIIVNEQTFTVNQAAFGPIVVTTLNDNGPGSLRQTIIDANNTVGDDTVVFQQGLNGSVDLATAELLITSNIVITGPGANVLTVQRSSAPNTPAFRIFNIRQGSVVSINGLTIAKGASTDPNNFRGAGILNQGSLTLSNSVVKDNIINGAGQGAGIYNEGALDITDSLITHNTIGADSLPSGAVGGGIYNTGTLSLTNTTVSLNSVRAVNFISGGGIANAGNGTLSLNNCFITGNSSIGTVNLERGTAIGGGISSATDISVTNTTINGNRAHYISTSGMISGSASGGGVSGSGTFTNSIIINNSTSCIRSCLSVGGGVSGSGTFINSLISNNSATIQSDPIFGDFPNRAFGGGVSGGGTFINSTVSSNSVSGKDSRGGGVFGNAIFRNATISNNSASGENNRGGGISGGETFGNTIISNNFAATAPNVDGTAVSEGFNLVGNTAGSTGWVASDIQNQDPRLAPLADNGGSTLTHALLPGSPAINAGNNANAPATDQRGLPRIVGGTIDIGAYEVQQIVNCSYSISPTSINVSPNGGNNSFSITTASGCQWAPQTNVSWITVQTPTGSGSGTINFSVSPNTSNARVGTITVSGQTFTVNQGTNCAFTPSATNISVGASGGNINVGVMTTAGCNWIAASNDSWITITSGASGTGSGNVFFSVSPNNGSPRTGSITVAGQTVTISQGAINCTYSLSATGAAFSASGGAGSFNVSALSDCSWSVDSAPNWIIINSGAGSGNGTVSFTVQTNTARQARSGVINVRGQTFTVNQAAALKTQFDFDGDGKADVSVFRPSTGDWYINQSSNNSFSGQHFGQDGDITAAADYDGDGKTDVAVFRSGFWYRINSTNGSFAGQQFGVAEDIPVAADYDGDGKADIAVFRPSNGTWYRSNSSDNQFVSFRWGTAGDKPLVGDFDGDGKTDYAVFRPSNGTWYIVKSSDNLFYAVNFGVAEDIPTAADFDGDRKTDIAVFRPSAGSWYRINSSNGQFFAQQFGVTQDIPVAADYDGDGKSDVAVFRNGYWYISNSSNGNFHGLQFGVGSDKPIQQAFR